MNTPQNRFRNHMRSLPVILGLCLVVAGCSQGAVEEEKPVELAPLAVETATVARKSITEFLEVDGSFVVPQGSDAKVSSVVAGRLLKVLVNEGDQVKAGQLLAVVDTKVLSAMSRGAKDAARVSGAMSLQAKLNYEGAVADQRASVQLAEQNLASAVAETDANVAIAKADLDKLKAGARPQEISQAEHAVAQAQMIATSNS